MDELFVAEPTKAPAVISQSPPFPMLTVTVGEPEIAAGVAEGVDSVVATYWSTAGSGSCVWPDVSINIIHRRNWGVGRALSSGSGCIVDAYPVAVMRLVPTDQDSGCQVRVDH